MTNEIRCGQYRHFKGNEYEVLGMVRHSETGKKWCFTVRCTAKAACGCARRTCGMKRWSGMERCFSALPISVRIKRNAE